MSLITGIWAKKNVWITGGEIGSDFDEGENPVATRSALDTSSESIRYRLN